VLRLAWAGVIARRTRMALVALAVVAGVAFTTGTLVLTATIGASFGDLFGTIERGVDVQVRQRSDLVRQGRVFRGRIDASLVPVVAAVPGVRAAVGRIEGPAYLVGADGKAVTDADSPVGPEPLGRAWVDDQGLNPFRIAEGRPPQGPGEVVVDVRAARRGGLVVGGRTDVLTKGEPASFTVVGLARFGSADSVAGTTSLFFAPAEAMRLLAEPGRVDAVDVAVADGAGRTAVRDAIARMLPPGVEAVDGTRVIAEAEGSTRERLRFFDAFLAIFAVLAVVVGAFLIANTFAITVGQRTGELALLRALGAGRTQVRALVLVEAALIGLVGTVAGVLVGVGVAAAGRPVVAALGASLPSAPLVVERSSVLIGIAVGMVMTVGSAVVPAVLAGRVPPMAALAAVTVERRPPRARSVAGVVAAALGSWVMWRGAQDAAIGLAGLGVVVLFAGAVLAAPGLAAPATRLLAAPLPRLRGVPGRLARENAGRNPRRTATTALALTMGASVGAFAVVLVSSLERSLTGAVQAGISADLVVRGAGFGFGGLPTSLAGAIAQLDEVAVVSPQRYAFAQVGGPVRPARRAPVVPRDETRPIGALDTSVADRLLDLGRVEGRLADVGPGAVGVSQRELDERGWNVGDVITLAFPGRAPEPFRIAASFSQPLLFDFVIGLGDAERLVPDQFDFLVYVGLADGVGADEGRAAIAAAVRRVPIAAVDDLRSYTAELAGSLDQLLGLVALLLLLAVGIATVGIGITLSLTVHERTREIGLLRVVGMDRSQTRRMVRWEAVVIALFGTAVGTAVGIAAAWALVRALRAEGIGSFALPWRGLVGLALLAFASGVVAAVAPARRAARLDVLEAVAVT